MGGCVSKVKKKIDDRKAKKYEKTDRASGIVRDEEKKVVTVNVNCYTTSVISKSKMA
jgi:hypothetical protein